MKRHSTRAVFVFLGAVLSSSAFAASPPASLLPPGGSQQAYQTQAVEAPIRLAQATDLSRLQQLEDEMRRLNGRVEELSFQLLQAQEDMRRAQENNEFRFQDLEQGGTSGGTGSGATQQRGDLGTPAPAIPSEGSGDDIAAILGNPDIASTGSTPSQPTAPQGGAGSSQVYSAAYDQLLAGDYAEAEQSFRQYVQTYPSAADTPDAEYWLGESLYQQQKYADAAEVFLNAQKAHPDASKAPEMMLKLGMSLAGLGSADTACATFREVESRYPSLSDNVRRKLGEEKNSANC